MRPLHNTSSAALLSAFGLGRVWKVHSRRPQPQSLAFEAFCKGSYEKLTFFVSRALFQKSLKVKKSRSVSRFLFDLCLDLFPVCVSISSRSVSRECAGLYLASLPFRPQKYYSVDRQTGSDSELARLCPFAGGRDCSAHREVFHFAAFLGDVSGYVVAVRDHVAFYFKFFGIAAVLDADGVGW